MTKELTNDEQEIGGRKLEITCPIVCRWFGTKANHNKIYMLIGCFIKVYKKNWSESECI